MAISPLAPVKNVELPEINGVRLAAAAAAVKYKNRLDLMLIELTTGSTIAGVFTQSLTASAPVEWCQRILDAGKARAIIVNSGNSNAFTGKQGDKDVGEMVAAVSNALGCTDKEVFVASTGVIGETLPVHRICKIVPQLRDNLAAQNWLPAAQAIMTTDTFAKGATQCLEMDGVPVTMNGIAKGSGMIAPDMATMLAFVFTDAKIPAHLLQKLLKKANNKTFNSITVDGDTSTSDTLLLAASGKAEHGKITQLNQLTGFYTALEALLTDLATQVVKDGEGASKFITIDVTGATSAVAARKIGMSIANSPLVKTAIAGEDANWGRVVMAVGKAGQKADRDALKISMGGVLICEKGQAAVDYDEAQVAAHLKTSQINIHVDVGVGRGKARVWTCDLTHDYISINADYRS